MYGVIAGCDIELLLDVTVVFLPVTVGLLQFVNEFLEMAAFAPIPHSLRLCMKSCMEWMNRMEIIRGETKRGAAHTTTGRC